jgi:hypothetical protein
MKNFSDLLATDLYLDLVLMVEPVGNPDAEIWIDHQLIHQGQLSQSITISKQLPLLTKLSVSIKLKNKIYSSDSEIAIVLNKLSVDGFDIIPSWTHLAQYINDHDYHDPTSYLGFNGEWKLEIPEPFYQWRHQITGQGWLLRPSKLPT